MSDHGCTGIVHADRFDKARGDCWICWRKKCGCGGKCGDCPDEPEVPGARIDAMPPARRVPVDLGPLHFNAGMVALGGSLLLASRRAIAAHSGESTIQLTFLDRKTFQPNSTPPRTLVIDHPLALLSQEDPRVWSHGNGQVRVAFAGCETMGRTLSSLRVRQMYAELDEDLRAVAIHAPAYGEHVEKNWMPFSIGDRQFFVYSIKPHRVLEVVGSDVITVYETPNNFPWSGRHLRGGAPPVLLGDRFGVWIHGCVAPPQKPTDRWEQNRVYNVGYYEFESKPPFRIIRQSPDPLLWAKEHEVQRPAYGSARVVFPCGAIVRDGRWFVSAGVGDQRVEILEWPML
jgi:predicted GH43/DUF377 family glycosyl hydrolase